MDSGSNSSSSDGLPGGSRAAEDPPTVQSPSPDSNSSSPDELAGEARIAEVPATIQTPPPDSVSSGLDTLPELLDHESPSAPSHPPERVTQIWALAREAAIQSTQLSEDAVQRARHVQALFGRLDSASARLELEPRARRTVQAAQNAVWAARTTEQAALLVQFPSTPATTGSVFRTAQEAHVGDQARYLLGRLFAPSPGRRLGIARTLANMKDRKLQEEKRQIRMQIEATNTAKLAPKLNETELIQQLVLQFLQHDGYLETARAFAEEVHEEKKALSLDLNAIINGFDVKEDEDAGHRQRIRTAILEGDVEKALKYTNAYYPHVLKDNEHVYFRLKCLRFIEMNRQGAEMLNHNNSSTTNGTKKANGHQNASYYEEYVDHGMELDDQSNQVSNWDRMDTEEPAANSQAEYSKLMEETLLYGQQLQAEFKDDPRREVKKALDDVFALLAYQDPFNSKEVCHLLDPSGRVAVAEELNSAILLSLGKSSSAALEQLYQQTTVLLEDLREGGGPGAFVNIDDYVNPNKRPSRP